MMMSTYSAEFGVKTKGLMIMPSIDRKWCIAGSLEDYGLDCLLTGRGLLDFDASERESWREMKMGKGIRFKN